MTAVYELMPPFYERATQLRRLPGVARPRIARHRREQVDGRRGRGPQDHEAVVIVRRAFELTVWMTHPRRPSPAFPAEPLVEVPLTGRERAEFELACDDLAQHAHHRGAEP